MDTMPIGVVICVCALTASLCIALLVLTYLAWKAFQNDNK
jgi:hypothetical protein